MHKINARLALLPVLVMFILLFVGGPDNHDSRLLKEFWESGHFFLFLGLSYILQQIPLINRKSVWFKLTFSFLFCAVLGYITEVFQLMIGRDFQYQDVASDTIGGIAGFLLAQFSRRNRLRKNVLLIALFGVTTVIGMRAVLFAAIDELLIHQEFPMLADGESRFELRRWDYYSSILSLSDEYHREGESSIKVEFCPARFSDISLEYFNRDWTHFSNLQFSLYNPSTKALALNLKIYDKTHWRSGFRFSDRFNKELNIKPGWNDISLPLSAVKSSPTGREMDLREVKSVSFFIEAPDVQTVVYLDSLRLTK